MPQMSAEMYIVYASRSDSRRLKKQAFVLGTSKTPVAYMASRMRTARLVENMG